MTQELTPGSPSPFESIRRVNATGNESWSSREIAKVLGYSDYRNFERVMEDARTACFNSGQPVADHFVDVTDMIEIGKGGKRQVKTVMLSRYACYLAIQNADPGKEIVAQGQTYFATQTRRQELSDEETEEQRRLTIRGELRQHNSSLPEAAKNAGVIEPRDYAIFQNHGYVGLYGGLGAQDIHRHKGLKKSQQILDHMGSTELAANLFRATQAEDKLRREQIHGKVGYFLQVLDFEPRVLDGSGKLRPPSEFKTLQFEESDYAQLVLACFNSSLFYWFMTVFSDCRHMNKREVDAFPINLKSLSDGSSKKILLKLATRLMADLKAHSISRKMKFKHDELTVQCIYPKNSKPIIDQIDTILATHYGFTPEELDFIINYDIKYRMGLGGGSAEEEYEGSAGVSPASSFANEDAAKMATLLATLDPLLPP